MTDFVFSNSGTMPVYEWRMLYQAQSALVPLVPTPPAIFYSNNLTMPIFEHRLLYQAFSTLVRLPVAVDITGVMRAIETGDIFLAGGMFWNRVVSGEIGVIEASFTGAEIGVIEKPVSVGTSGAIEMAVAPATGTAVSTITSAHVSILII